MGIMTFLVLLVAAIVVFSVQNASPVAVTFLFWKFDASLAIVIFLSLITGVIAGSIITFRARRGRNPGRDGRAGGQASPPGPDRTMEF